MEGLSSPGIGSGIDITGLVTSLVNASIQPKTQRLNQQEFDIQTRISAVAQIKGTLSNFQSSLSSLKSMDSFQTRKATVSNKELLTVSTTSDAAESNYQIEVNQLAKKQSLASSAFTDSTTTVGSGTITIEFGSYDGGYTTFTANPDKSSKQITISNSADSLAEIRDTINNSDAGISASIVTDESGAKLLLSSDDTGTKNALKITVTDDDGNHTDNSGLSQLIYDPAAGNSHLSQTVAAQDSSVQINGLTLTHHSNELKDNIDGLTINLLKASPGDIVNVDVTNDKIAARNQIQGFVNQFNAVMTVIGQLTGYDPESETAGIFLGDGSTRALKAQLRDLLYQPIENASSHFSTITEIGISTNDNGLLEIDDAKLDDVFDNHFDEVGRLFAHGAYTDDPLIEVNNLSDDVPAGIYAINLTTVNVGTTLDGSIGNLSATSDDGNILLGSGNLSNLSLKVLGGATGNRGNVTVFEGLAAKFDALLETYLGTNGTLETRTTSLESQIEDINDARANLELRAQKIESTYFKKFNAMDSQLAQLESLSNFLTQQLANTPFANQGDK